MIFIVIKKKTPSLISINWRYYDNERKQNEIEELIKEVSSDEIKWAKLIDEFSTLKLLINEKGNTLLKLYFIIIV